MNTTTEIRSVRGLACLGAAAMITLGLFSPAFAADPADPYARTASVTVKYGELDLAKPEGISELYRRIYKAADQVCGGVPSGPGFWQKQQYRQCKEVAIADAVRKVNNGSLTAFHEGAMGKGNRAG